MKPCANTRVFVSLFRDGDTVVIRASADGSTLDILDNHKPDPTAVAAEHGGGGEVAEPLPN